jgi:predicted membrane GTPase involved in stress response
MSIDIEKIRNIAVIAHGGAGKTSLVETMLFNAKATDRIGTIEDGNMVTDFEAEEINRKISISSAMAFCDWNGHRINIVDTPGFMKPGKSGSSPISMRFQGSYLSIKWIEKTPTFRTRLIPLKKHTEFLQYH